MSTKRGFSEYFQFDELYQDRLKELKLLERKLHQLKIENKRVQQKRIELEQKYMRMCLARKLVNIKETFHIKYVKFETFPEI